MMDQVFVIFTILLVHAFNLEILFSPLIFRQFAFWFLSEGIAVGPCIWVGLLAKRFILLSHHEYQSIGLSILIAYGRFCIVQNL